MIEAMSNRESILTAENAPAHEIHFDAIPEKLRRLPRWVNWKWSKCGKKWTKVPVHPKGYNASSTDSGTWSDFYTVSQAVSDHGYGVGFVFNGDGLVGVDLDDCRNPQTGVIAPWAQHLIKTLSTYSEISPSGTGVKLFLTGALPDQFRKKHNRPDGIGGVEIFSSGRFFTVTGLHLSGTSEEVQERNADLNSIYESLCEWMTVEKPSQKSVHSFASEYRPSTSDAETARLALSVISPDLGYEEWLSVLMACHSADPSYGMMAEVVNWSRGSEKFVEGEIEKKWNKFSGSKGVGIGTLCKMADDTGRAWRPVSRFPDIIETAESRLKNALDVAMLELGAKRSIDQVTPSLIRVLTSLQRPTEAEGIDKEIADPGLFPESLLAVPGLLNDIVEYNLRGAIRPQRELAVAAAMALLGTVMGRKVEGHLNTRTNVYLIGLGESGCGKERARKVTKDLLKSAGMSFMLPCENVASAAGLIDAVTLCPSMLLMIDEIHKTLATTKDASRNPHMFELIGTLLTLFTSSSSEYLGKAYSGKKKDTRIDQPCLSLYGTGVPKGVWQSLTTDQLSDGFLSRLLLIESSNADPAPIRNPDCSPPPDKIVEQIKWWGNYKPPGNDFNCLYAVPRVVGDGPGVSDLFADGEDHYRSLRRPNQAADGIWTRATEKARKLALIHQLSRDRDAFQVDLHAAEWALQFVEHVTRRTLFHANQWVSDTRHGNEKLAVLRTIRESGGTATLTRICRAHRGLKGKERSDILADLCSEGSIRLCEAQTSGRATIAYELVG